MTRRHEEELLDAALADSFPASDPPAMSVPAPPTPEQTDATPVELTLLYRVVSAEDGSRAFDAQPPYPAGRWTSEGTPALYASLSPGAALLEKLVHLEGHASDRLVLAIGSMPSGGLAEVPLPSGWDAFPHRQSVQRAGDAWLQAHCHLGLQVPSAVLHAESNVILDVEHPDFFRVKLLETRPVQLDHRLFAVSPGP